MDLRECILTANNCYRYRVDIKPVGIMVHSTGANNPNLCRYVQPLETDPNYDELVDHLGFNRYGNDWNCAKPGGLEVCVHAFIGRASDGSVATYQTLPWTVRGWHSGYASKSSRTNANKLGYIGFEICEDNLADAEYFAKVYREAVELTAHLCKMFNLDPQADGVVICHSEGFDRGLASEHADVMHWLPKHGKTMTTFRRDVADLLNAKEENPVKPEPVELDPVERTLVFGTLEDVPEWYRPSIRKLMELGAFTGHSDPDPSTFDDNVLNVSEDFCRVMTVIDRLGLIK